MELYENPATGKQQLDTYIKVPRYLDIPPTKSEAVRGQPEPLVCALRTHLSMARQLIFLSGCFTVRSTYSWRHSSTTSWCWTPCESQLSREIPCQLRRSHIIISSRLQCCLRSGYDTWHDVLRRWQDMMACLRTSAGSQFLGRWSLRRLRFGDTPFRPGGGSVICTFEMHDGKFHETMASALCVHVGIGLHTDSFCETFVLIALQHASWWLARRTPRCEPCRCNL